MTKVIDNNIVQPVDIEVGGDSDFPGIAQTVTLDDIEAIAFSDQPLEDRKRQLAQLREQLVARQTVDGGGEMAALVQELDRSLAQMNDHRHGEVASRAALGMTPDELLDTLPPDER